MNWTNEDIQISLEQSDYIDTAIIPLCIVSWGVQALEDSYTYDYVNKVSIVLERQLKGRSIVFPSFLYSGTTTDIDKFVQPLIQQLINEQVKNIFILTCNKEINLPNSINIPNLPIHKMDYENQMILINAQVEEVVKFIHEQWKIAISID